MEPQETAMRSMTTAHEGSTKLDKSTEINSSMTISDSAQDAYTSKIFNIGG